MCFIRRLRMTLLATFAAVLAQPVVAEPAQPVLIIVDGSGSMWGKMEGDATAKLYGVRDLLRERLLVAPAQSRIGLSSFGHRRKGDCGDVELIAPIEAGGSQGTIAALDQLNPKGKGPLTTAVREGAKAIGAGTGGHIILIHDNADNCSQDVCAAASDIAKTNPGLRVHVVSLGLSKPERDRMQCLAATTKGLQFDATNQTDIASALTKHIRGRWSRSCRDRCRSAGRRRAAPCSRRQRSPRPASLRVAVGERRPARHGDRLAHHQIRRTRRIQPHSLNARAAKSTKPSSPAAIPFPSLTA